MKNSRKTALGLAGLIAMVLIVITLHIAPIRPTSYLARSLLDALHAPGFAVLAVVLFTLATRYLSSRFSYTIAVVGSITIAFLAEAAQFFSARDADFRDIAFDVLGIAAGIACVATYRLYRLGRNAGRRKKVAHALVAGVLTISCLWTTGWYVSMIALRWLALPVLLSFENDWESSIHQSYPDNALQIDAAPGDWPIAGQSVGFLHLSAARYPGLKFDPYPDWRGYASLSFVIASATSKPERFQLRILDRTNTPGFDREYLAMPVPTRITVSLDDAAAEIGGRALDIGAITEVRIRSLQAADGPWLIVDDFRLESE